MNANRWVIAVLPLLVAACSGDPYQRELPATAILSPHEVNQIADDLLESDKAIFLRWAKRMDTPDRFVGEVVPYNVKSRLGTNRNLNEGRLWKRRK